MLAENIAMKIIGLITTVVVLGAVYLFIVKPVLDTTNQAFDSVGSFQDEISTAFDDAGINGISVDEIQDGDFRSLQQQIESSGASKKQQRRAEKLLKCIQRVQPNTTKMQACAERFG